MRYLYLNLTDTSLFIYPRYPAQLMLIMTLQVCVVIARPRAVLAPVAISACTLGCPQAAYFGRQHGAFPCCVLLHLSSHYYPPLLQTSFTNCSDSTPLDLSGETRQESYEAT